jgi:carboxymethylenebutenolidase
MKAAGKTYEPVTYDGAGHGFMRAGEAPDASDANKKARDDVDLEKRSRSNLFCL